MTAPTISLATSEDMRSITSQNLDEIKRLPFLYIPTAEPDVMRSWGVAQVSSFHDFERLCPAALVSPPVFR